MLSGPDPVAATSGSRLQPEVSVALHRDISIIDTVLLARLARYRVLLARSTARATSNSFDPLPSVTGMRLGSHPDLVAAVHVAASITHRASVRFGATLTA